MNVLIEQKFQCVEKYCKFFRAVYCFALFMITVNFANWCICNFVSFVCLVTGAAILEAVFNTGYLGQDHIIQVYFLLAYLRGCVHHSGSDVQWQRLVRQTPVGWLCQC